MAHSPIGILGDAILRAAHDLRNNAAGDDAPALMARSTPAIRQRDQRDIDRIAELERLVATQQRELASLRSRPVAPPPSTAAPVSALYDASIRFSLLEYEGKDG